MASPSKEKQILKLIFENSPLKRWHFQEFIKEAKITKNALNKWLKKYQKEKLIKRIKEKGKFPYFICKSNNPVYKSQKKIYMLNELYESGLIGYLTNLDKAKTIIIFGSIARGDWYKDSDIDIFIFGEVDKIEKNKFESKLHRDIELHVFEKKEDIKKVKTGLIQNIIDGFIVKGSIQSFAKVV